jgi:lipid-A-disaccharide synthase-like uncharacterized protein
MRPSWGNAHQRGGSSSRRWDTLTASKLALLGDAIMTAERVWVAIGLAGQGAFAMRLLLQWIQSERRKRSVVPIAFWYWSLGGGLTLLAYAIHRRDPVFILGQLFGVVIYLRNLYLIRAASGTAAGAQAMPPPTPGETETTDLAGQIGPSGRIVLGAFALYFAAQVVLRLLTGTTVSFDEGEQIVLTQRFLLGYTSQPPLYTWLQSAVFALVGRGVLGLALLKNALLFSIYLFVWLIARRVSGSERTASTAVLATFLLPQISWEAQRDLTHSVLLTVASLAAVWALLRLAEDHRPRNAVLFGVCAGVGFLSKHNSVLFLAALLAAALSVREIRRRLRARDLLLGLGLAVLLAAPHFLWAAQHLSETTLQAGKLGIGRGSSLLAGSWRGFKALVEASVGFLAPLAFACAVFVAVGRHAAPMPPAWPAGAALVRRMMVTFLLLTAVAIGISRATTVKEHWLMPALSLASIPAAIALENRWSRAGRRAFVAVVALSAVAVLLTIASRFAVPAWTGRYPRIQTPYEPIARQIREAGFTRGILVAPDQWIAGNLDQQFPDSLSIFADLAVFPTRSDVPWVFVWNPTWGKEIGQGGPAPNVRIFAAERRGFDLPAVSPRRALARYSSTGGLALELEFVVVPPPARRALPASPGGAGTGER